jgi:hypothetical protein
MFGPEGNPKHFLTFCPEVMFDRFGVFASTAHDYADESDRDREHERLGRDGAAPTDWRWEWASISRLHYSECPVYSPLLHDSTRQTSGPSASTPITPDQAGATLPGGEDRTPKRTGMERYGRWETVGQPIGRGGQGEVLKVRDTSRSITELCALKRLKRNATTQARARFRQEVEVAQAATHRNALRLYDSDLEAERPYYVAEYCEGGSLQERGAELFKGDIKSALEVLMPILDALVVFHQDGKFHRDVKPGNILFRRDHTPVIGDYGLFSTMEGEGVTLVGEAVGPRYFIAPEMEAGGRHLGEPSDCTDVYSLGKVLYWMLSGGRRIDREEHRAPGNNLVQVLQGQRWEHVNMLLDKMLVREPGGRLHSQELKEGLQMAANLVEGNYAPLTPSIGIECRFCGRGKYEKWAAYDGTDQSVSKPYGTKERIQKRLGLNPTQFTNIRVLRCSNCGHIEWFQLTDINTPHWWEK